jgi:hypothetical protein
LTGIPKEVSPAELQEGEQADGVEEAGIKKKAQRSDSSFK